MSSLNRQQFTQPTLFDPSEAPQKAPTEEHIGDLPFESWAARNDVVHHGTMVTSPHWDSSPVTHFGDLTSARERLSNAHRQVTRVGQGPESYMGAGYDREFQDPKIYSRRLPQHPLGVDTDFTTTNVGILSDDDANAAHAVKVWRDVGDVTNNTSAAIRGSSGINRPENNAVYEQILDHKGNGDEIAVRNLRYLSEPQLIPRLPAIRTAVDTMDRGRSVAYENSEEMGDSGVSVIVPTGASQRGESTKSWYDDLKASPNRSRAEKEYAQQMIDKGVEPNLPATRPRPLRIETTYTQEPLPGSGGETVTTSQRSVPEALRMLPPMEDYNAAVRRNKALEAED